MGACRVTISHLLPPTTLKPKTGDSKLQKGNPKTLKTSKPAPSSVNRRLLLLSLPSYAAILANTSQSNSCFALTTYDPISPVEKDASLSISQRIAEAIRLLDRGRELQAEGDFNGALGYFTQVIRNYKDFAFSDYARVGRALALYELGDRDQAIVEMEDVSVSLKGYPEVHAALAAALYADKHAPLLAENQFTIATLLDPHYSDISYVKDIKHWPPSLVSSLQHFITLS